uniref:Uncharacterized protein n=1 Tax=Pristionchus pacificus TaxID=54126 RepID=A0A2A6BW03_PRIPA|eukprot:PDM70006.1 hypothetical protein PRIPAC_49218 [Pristionchus pacificus]
MCKMKHISKKNPKISERIYEYPEKSVQITELWPIAQNVYSPRNVPSHRISIATNVLAMRNHCHSIRFPIQRKSHRDTD